MSFGWSVKRKKERNNVKDRSDENAFSHQLRINKWRPNSQAVEATDSKAQMVLRQWL